MNPTPDQIEKEMIRLYNANYSMSSIASQLKDIGVTISKNGVIGRISRMIKAGRLLNREHVDNRKHAPDGKIKFNTCPHLQSTHRAEMEYWNYPSNEKSVILLNLNSKSCRFPCSDGLFCGQDKQEHSSYCAEHHAVICQPNPKRKRVSNLHTGV